jgi:hypothetical protein
MMITKETFERLRQLVIDYDNAIFDRIGSAAELATQKAECEQHQRDISELEKMFMGNRAP